MTKKSFIWVTFQKEGIHKYPAAGTDPKLSEVSFLQYPHRHIFHFKVWLEVFNDDRDVEFILFKRWLESLYTQNILELDFMSCEMISDKLHEMITKQYPNRDVKIDVSEDGENGSYIEYPYESPTPLSDTDDKKITDSIDDININPDPLNLKDKLADIAKNNPAQNIDLNALGKMTMSTLVSLLTKKG